MLLYVVPFSLFLLYTLSLFCRSTIIEHTLKQFQGEAESVIIYHYCSFQDHPQLLSGDVLASLVDQLQRRATSISPCLRHMYEERNRDHRASRSADLLMEPLRELISSFEETCLFVDALDELDSNHINDLLKLLSSIKKWAIPSLHVFVTSQFHHLSIRESLETLTDPNDRIDLATGLSNEADIRNHVHSTLVESPQFSRRWSGSKNHILAEIETALAEKSDSS